MKLIAFFICISCCAFSQGVFQVDSTFVKFGNEGFENADNAQVRISHKIANNFNFDVAGVMDFTKLTKASTEVINYKSFGSFAGAPIQSSTNWNDITGLVNGFDLGFSANVSRVMGMYDNPLFRGSCNVTSRIAVYVANPTLLNSATLANNTGIYIAPQTSGSNIKSIHVGGNNLSLFNGVVQIDDISSPAGQKRDILLLSKLGDGNYNTTEQIAFQNGSHMKGRIKQKNIDITGASSNYGSFILSLSTSNNGVDQNSTTDMFFFKGNGNFGIGSDFSYSAMTNGLIQKSGNPPQQDSSIVDSYQLYAKDIVSGNSAPHFKTENKDVIRLYKYIDSAFGNTINTGDSSTNAAILSIINALKSHGLISE